MDLNGFCFYLKALFPAVTVCNQNRVNCDLLNELVTNCTTNISHCSDSDQLAILTRLSTNACTQVSRGSGGNGGSGSSSGGSDSGSATGGSDSGSASGGSDSRGDSGQNQEREKRSISQTSERNVSK